LVHILDGGMGKRKWRNCCWDYNGGIGWIEAAGAGDEALNR